MTRWFLEFMCFFARLCPFKPNLDDSPDEFAWGVMFASVFNGVAAACIVYYFDFPKDLMGIPSNAHFWPIFKVFGFGIGIWTLLGCLFSIPLAEEYKRIEEEKQNQRFSEITQNMLNKIRESNEREAREAREAQNNKPHE